jgi:hypothetical protein
MTCGSFQKCRRGTGNCLLRWRAAAWGRSGRELLYESTGALMHVQLTTSRTFQASAPSKLLDGPYVYGALELSYNVAANGRFGMIREVAPLASSPSARLVLLRRWFDALTRRPPMQ